MFIFLRSIFLPKSLLISGWGGIRTHGSLTTTPVFKTGALNRSATHPFIFSYANHYVWQYRMCYHPSLEHPRPRNNAAQIEKLQRQSRVFAKTLHPESTAHPRFYRDSPKISTDPSTTAHESHSRQIRRFPMDLRNLNQLSPLDHTISPMNLCRFSFLATLFSPLSSSNRTAPKTRLSA